MTKQEKGRRKKKKGKFLKKIRRVERREGVERRKDKGRTGKRKEK